MTMRILELDFIKRDENERTFCYNICDTYNNCYYSSSEPVSDEEDE